MRLRWSERARRDLVAIARYIARDNPDAARRWVAKLRKCALSASERPLLGRVVPEFNREDTREVLLANYRVVYLTRPGDLLVLTVFEGHRLFPAPAAHASPAASLVQDDDSP